VRIECRPNSDGARRVILARKVTSPDSELRASIFWFDGSVSRPLPCGLRKTTSQYSASSSLSPLLLQEALQPSPGTRSRVAALNHAFTTFCAKRYSSIRSLRCKRGDQSQVAFVRNHAQHGKQARENGEQRQLFVTKGRDANFVSAKPGMAKKGPANANTLQLIRATDQLPHARDHERWPPNDRANAGL
jgi:hypothetical protein